MFCSVIRRSGTSGVRTVVDSRIIGHVGCSVFTLPTLADVRGGVHCTSGCTADMVVGVVYIALSVCPRRNGTQSKFGLLAFNGPSRSCCVPVCPVVGVGAEAAPTTVDPVAAQVLSRTLHGDFRLTEVLAGPGLSQGPLEQRRDVARLLP